MNTLHSILTSAFDVVLRPLSAHPLMALLFVSAVTGILLAVVFRYTSDQAALRRVVDRAGAELLAIKLFKEDPWITLVCLKELFKQSGLRLWYSIPSLLLMAVPFVLLLMQLGMRFVHRPALPHEPILIEAVLSEEAWPRHDQLTLEVSSPIQIEAGPHRDPTERILTWRIEAREAGEADLQFKLESESFTEPLSVADSPASLMAINSIVKPPLPLGASVESIALHYPSRSTPLFGYSIPWWLTFLLVAMLFALITRPLVKVQF